MAAEVDFRLEDTNKRPIVDSHLELATRSKYGAVRNVVDWLIALPLLLVCVPLLVTIAAAIRIDSEGPAFFAQRRVGKDGRPFKILKFRTMHVEAPAYSLKVADHSPVVTRIGRILRRTGLDELPQLWNVVCGHMAIIGPRSEQVELMDLYEPWQRQRHLVKPGITGWWQIHHRDGIPLHLNVDKDLYYIQHQGLGIDWLILTRTCTIILAALSDGFHARRSRASLDSSIEIESQEGDLATELGNRTSSR